MRKKCPTCGSKMIIRNSEEITPICTYIYYVCCNTKGCSETSRYTLSQDHIINPSIIKRADTLSFIALSAIKTMSSSDQKKLATQLQLEGIF